MNYVLHIMQVSHIICGFPCEQIISSIDWSTVWECLKKGDKKHYKKYMFFFFFSSNDTYILKLLFGAMLVILIGLRNNP